jgi:hypothetical protein
MLLNDPDRLEKMMRRVGGFVPGSDFRNKMATLDMLLNTDVPALLDAFDQLSEDRRENKYES